MNRKFRLYLQDILRASELIQNFVGDETFDQFLMDEKTISAVVRQFEIIGEAAKNIPDQIRDRYAHLAWRSMAGMRDRLVHGYFGIDYQLVWDSIQKDVPYLIQEIPKIIEEEKD